MTPRSLTGFTAHEVQERLAAGRAQLHPPGADVPAAVHIAADVVHGGVA